MLRGRLAFSLALAACGAVGSGCSLDSANVFDYPDAGWIDAMPSDASIDASPVDGTVPDTGTLQVSWILMRNGLELSCEDFGADLVTVNVDLPDHGGVELPCSDGIASISGQSLATHQIHIAYWRSDNGGSARTFLLASTIKDATLSRPGRTAYVPVITDVFDEPEKQLRQLFAAAKLAYEQSAPPKRFPSSEAPTPFVSCCVVPAAICQPDASHWVTTTWTELGFSVDGPSRVHYSVTSAGEGLDAVIQLEATVDSDCDVQFGTYRITGSVTADGEVVGGDTITRDYTD